MDRWSSKKPFEDHQPSSKKGVGVVLRDRFNNSNNSCKFLTCSDEKKAMKFTRFVSSSYKKEKSVLSTFRSSTNLKKVTGSSSSSSSLKSEKQPLSQRTIDSSEDDAETDKLEPECSNLPSSSRIKRGFRQRFGLSKQEFRPGSSSQATSANRGCSPLLSGVIQSGFGLDKRFNQKVDTVHKRKANGESSSSSSSAKGKIVKEPSTEERRHGFNPKGSGSASRQARHCILGDGNNIENQRLVNSGIRFSNRGRSGRNGLSSVTTTETSQTETSNNLNSPLSLELFSGSLSSQDSFHSYNLDGISEILPELDRIEQDIELNYEELLVMETGLVFGGLSFYDQHRDMRLDIDNMSYEELLALEERIGTVSTALAEESISKCLKTSIYQMKPSSYESITKTKSPCDHKEDAKCSICQEEYTIGDELGKLHCKHTYHMKCVQHWLRMKSWCPICKATAETFSE